MSEANAMELGDPEIGAAAREALEIALGRPGMNEFRALYVALRMIGELMDRTGARVVFGHAAEQAIRELAGEEDMQALRAMQNRAFGMRRKREDGLF